MSRRRSVPSAPGAAGSKASRAGRSAALALASESSVSAAATQPKSSVSPSSSIRSASARRSAAAASAAAAKSGRTGRWRRAAGEGDQRMGVPLDGCVSEARFAQQAGGFRANGGGVRGGEHENALGRESIGQAREELTRRWDVLDDFSRHRDVDAGGCGAGEVGRRDRQPEPGPADLRDRRRVEASRLPAEAVDGEVKPEAEPAPDLETERVPGGLPRRASRPALCQRPVPCWR